MAIDGPRAQMQPMTAQESGVITLTRRRGEAVVLQTPQGFVTVRIEKIGGHYGGVKLAIDAPREVLVDRLEVRQERERQSGTEAGQQGQ